MSDRDATGGRPGDMPWNDVPADSDVIPGTEEPDPAEVHGSEDDDAEVDDAAADTPDPSEKYRRESLDERLAEEEPERPERSGARAVDVYDAADGDDAGAAEANDDDSQPGDQSAEESAMHLTDEP